jgi:hypothetical protein
MLSGNGNECKSLAAGVEHFVFMSLIDCDEGLIPENVFHIKSKRLMEAGAYTRALLSST